MDVSEVGMPASIRSIAKALDVSIATVSRALRGDPKIGAATRSRVKAEAARQGYRPNPALSRAAGRRARNPSSQAGEPLAFLQNSRLAERPQQMGVSLITGARARAEELGYALKVFELDDFASAESLDRALYTSGVQGILLGAFLGAHPEGLPMRWERYAGVWLGQRSLPLELPLVRSSYLNAIHESVNALARTGYTRMGSILWKDKRHPYQHFAQHAALRGFETEPPENMIVIPPLVLESGKWRRGLVRAYLKQHAPDLLLVQDYGMYMELRNLGLGIPEDLGVALIYLPGGGIDSDGRSIAGIQSISHVIGREAVNLIDTALRHGSYGLGDSRELILKTMFTTGDTLASQVG